MPFLYTNTIPIRTMETDTLPPPIAKQLADLELRHKRHQQREEDQRLAKITAKERHKAGWHKRKLAPIHLCY